MRAALVLIVLALPFLDLWGVWELFHIVGPIVTSVLLIAAAVAGATIVLQERMRMGPRLQVMLKGGEWTLPSLLYTFRRLVAGILLIYPGVLSDVFAMVLLMLRDRVPVAETVKQSTAARVVDGEFRRLDTASEADADDWP